MKTLVIGLGNPILGDDGVGWKVIENLSHSIDAHTSIETDCLSLGGLSLMERMLDYEHVIIVDSIETGQCPEGSVNACRNQAVQFGGIALPIALSLTLSVALSCV